MSIKRSLFRVPPRLTGFVVLFFLFIGTQSFAVNPDVSDSDEAIAAGKSIFNANCKSCHKLDQKYTGPALRGVTDRRSIDWAKRFIRNSQALIGSGDAQAVAIYKEFNNLAMPSHEFLSDDDVLNLLSYIEYGEKAEAVVADAGAAGEGAGTGGGIPSEYLTIILAVLVVILLLILVVLVLIIYLTYQPTFCMRALMD
jgi:cytochrome c2